MTRRLNHARAIVFLVLFGAGSAAAEPAPAAAKPKQPPVLVDLDDPPLFGDSQGLLYLRTRHDLLRFYPHAQLALEGHGFFGAGITDLTAGRAGVDLAPRFFVRHSRFELAGEVLKRLAFSAAIELVANPAIDGAQADGRDTRVALDDAWGYIDAGRGLGLMLGVFQAPFSLENRTQTSDLAFMERSLAVRGLAAPAPKVLGAAITGSTYQGRLRWAAGAFGAEALAPGDFSRSFDGMLRVAGTPWKDVKNDEKRYLSLGFSLRGGTRNPRDTSTAAPAITSRQGYALWNPSHVDAMGNVVRVQQTGNQVGAGLELMIVPCKLLVVRGEGFWMMRQTRETLEDAPSGGAERGGSLHGFAWYAEVSLWPFAYLLHNKMPELGLYPHPDHLELSPAVPYVDRYGIEVALQAGQLNETYEAASRHGSADPSAPGSKISIYDLGFALNYWHTTRFKLGVNFNTYLTPGSGDPSQNLATVPSNLDGTDSHHLLELAARSTLLF